MKSYKAANISIGILTIIAIILFTLSLHTKKKGLIISAYMFFGFCCSPTLVVTLAFWSEISTRIKETTSTGLFFFFAQIVGVGLSYGCTAIVHTFNNTKGVYFWTGILIASCVIGCISSITLEQIEYQRAESLRTLASNSYLITQTRRYKPHVFVQNPSQSF